MLRRSRLAVLSALTLLFGTACLNSTDSSGPPVETDPAKITYDSSLHVNIASMHQTATGVYYQDLAVGTGDSTVTASSTVTVTYAGHLANGTLFDNHGGAPARFSLANVVPGFQQGMIGMKVGGSRLIVFGPALGYGSQPVGSIPAYSVLVFNVTVNSIP